MEIKRFFHSILRMLWLIVLLAGIGGGISAYSSYFTAVPVYMAETTVYALNKSIAVDGKDSVNYQDVMLSRQLLQDYKQIITSEQVLTLASKNLDKYSITPDQLKGMISVEPKNDSAVLGISAASYDPQIAAEASNEVTKAFVKSLQTLTNSNIVGILDEAKIPNYPVSNDFIKKTFIGTIAGIVIALAIIYIKELFDTTLRHIEEVEKYTKIRLMGVIPKYSIK